MRYPNIVPGCNVIDCRTREKGVVSDVNGDMVTVRFLLDDGKYARAKRVHKDTVLRVAEKEYRKQFKLDKQYHVKAQQLAESLDLPIKEVEAIMNDERCRR